jgi:hypothetical protein
LQVERKIGEKRALPEMNKSSECQSLITSIVVKIEIEFARQW